LDGSPLERCKILTDDRIEYYVKIELSYIVHNSINLEVCNTEHLGLTISGRPSSPAQATDALPLSHRLHPAKLH
jgi:hypothetical protein